METLVADMDKHLKEKKKEKRVHRQTQPMLDFSFHPPCFLYRTVCAVHVDLDTVDTLRQPSFHSQKSPSTLFLPLLSRPIVLSPPSAPFSPLRAIAIGER